jgi:hypothetical protein
MDVETQHEFNEMHANVLIILQKAYNLAHCETVGKKKQHKIANMVYSKFSDSFKKYGKTVGICYVLKKFNSDYFTITDKETGCVMTVNFNKLC